MKAFKSKTILKQLRQPSQTRSEAIWILPAHTVEPELSL